MVGVVVEHVSWPTVPARGSPFSIPFPAPDGQGPTPVPRGSAAAGTDGPLHGAPDAARRQADGGGPAWFRGGVRARWGGAGPVGGQQNVQMHFTMEIE